MGDELQIALSVATALGMLLLLIGLSQARAGRKAIASRLSSLLDSEEFLGRSQEVAGREDARAAGSRPEIVARAERTVLASRLGRWLHGRIAAAGLEITTSEYLRLHLVVGGLGAVVALAATRQPLPALLGGLGGLYLPWWYVESRRQHRQEAFTLQLADTVTLLVSALRAGQSLPQALQRVAKESLEPTAGELHRVSLEINMGLSVGVALQNLSARVGSRDLDLLVTSLEVQREVGGDIVPLMEAMGDMMRERHRIKAEVLVITAQQRMAAKIMFAMPIGIALLLFVLNPQYMRQMFSTERLLCGLPVFLMPAAVMLLLGLGYLTVRRAAKVEV